MGVDGDELRRRDTSTSLVQGAANLAPRPAVWSTPWSPRLSQPNGLQEHLIADCTVRHITEGGAARLLQELAYVHPGPDVKFPPIDDPPPGFILRFIVDRIGGVGPWAS